MEGGVGNNKCASVPGLSASGSWTSYSATVYPDFGTLSLTLYLTNGGPGFNSVNEFANVKVLPISVQTSNVNSANSTSRPPNLTISDTGYSQDWVGPAGAEHVNVDGMFNGWLTVPDAAPVDVHYRYAALLRVANVVSTLSLIALFLLLARRVRFRRYW